MKSHESGRPSQPTGWSPGWRQRPHLTNAPSQICTLVWPGSDCISGKYVGLTFLRRYSAVLLLPYKLCRAKGVEPFLIANGRTEGDHDIKVWVRQYHATREAKSRYRVLHWIYAILNYSEKVQM